MKNFYNNILKNNYIKNVLIEKYNINNILDFKLNNKMNIVFKNLNKSFDEKKCYIEFNSNLGGKDSEQIIEFFFNFYNKLFYFNKINYEILELDRSDYGYKKILYLLKENYSYFLFKNESGIHRIIRKNPLNSSNKIQTSYINVNVSPVLDSNIFFDKKDIIFSTYKSSGSGGQHVNTTNSAVRVTHVPTNIIVCCQSERSQIKNKSLAIKIIEYKILMRHKNYFNKYEKNINKKNKYVKTYYFENNEIVDHIKKQKYNLNFFFNHKYNFLNI